MKKFKLILIIIILTFLTTGCWDMIEINQRLFPYSIGVDLNDGEGEKYIITISYPNINAIGKNATQQERVHVISTIAPSVFQGSSQLYTRLQYPFYFKHLRVLVLGHEVARDGDAIREILDGLNRDFVINKKIRLVMAEEKARDLLSAVPGAKRQEVIEGTLFSMLRRTRTTSRYTPQTLTGFIKNTDIGGVALMPRTAAHGEDIKVFGACIFKNYEFIGHLGELENRAISLIRGSVKSDIIDAKLGDAPISYSLTDASAKKKLVREGENLKVRIDVELEGALQEYILRDNPLIDSASTLKDMEKAIETKLKEEINKTLELLQKEYKADAIGVGEYISKFHPKVWKEVSKDWDEIFSQMDIEVALTVEIRRRGLVQ
ncbi:Ger(x)C family spore germination protein [Tissierella carlieri]|uniref:Ger(x)C family spore germination protein n=1 Tax=Tissierella carlieri TaxID=689904 RepID=UPI00386A7F78